MEIMEKSMLDWGIYFQWVYMYCVVSSQKVVGLSGHDTVAQRSSGHFSSRTFKHYSLNHLQSQEPKAEGSKVSVALLFKIQGLFFI